MALMELPPISGSPNSGNSLPLQVGVEVVSFLSFSVFLALSHLGSVPNLVSGASLAQLPYAAHAASSAVRLSLSLYTSLLAGIEHFGALSTKIIKKRLFLKDKLALPLIVVRAQ